MKIGENKPISPDVAAPSGTDAKPVQGPEETFAERLADVSAGEAGTAQGAPAATAPSFSNQGVGSDLVAMAARVDGGELTADEAVRLLVERVLEAQLPPDASPEIRERIRVLVQASLESDPLLSSLVNRLGGGS